jgi:hypothetical protein
MGRCLRESAARMGAGTLAITGLLLLALLAPVGLMDLPSAAAAHEPSALSGPESLGWGFYYPDAVASGGGTCGWRTTTATP